MSDQVFCCNGACGILVPLPVLGTYADPTGDGKSFINFNLATSPLCGIPIAKVLQGNLEGLEGRDELARLNPSASSMRLRIHWPGYNKISPKINTPNERFKIEDLVRKVCDQIKRFIDTAQVSSGETPEWFVGEGGLTAEQLVLVSLKRISVGSWVPCIRLINYQETI